jgi:hypothetical protein
LIFSLKLTTNLFLFPPRLVFHTGFLITVLGYKQIMFNLMASWLLKCDAYFTVHGDCQIFIYHSQICDSSCLFQIESSSLLTSKFVCVCVCVYDVCLVYNPS